MRAATGTTRAGGRPRRLVVVPGFTLIEVLLVIAVVALVVGLLAPALAGVREAGRALECSSNLRQWALAANSYAGENKGFLPRRGQGVQPTVRLDRDADWFNALPVLLGERAYRDLFDEGRVPAPGDRTVWMCPSVVRADAGNCFAYGMNMRLSTWDAPQPDRLDSVGPIQSQVFMGEGPGSYCSLLPSSQPYSPVARHRGATGIAFVDSHVASFSGAYVGCGVGDPSRSDIVWVVPNSPWAGPPR